MKKIAKVLKFINTILSYLLLHLQNQTLVNLHCKV